MLRMILKYIWNERKSNLYLLVELLIVSTLTWYMIDYFFVNVRLIVRPVGFDISNCYQVHLGEISENSDEYDVEAGAPTIMNVLKLLARMEHLPEVEFASVSEYATPYCGNNFGAEMSFVGDRSKRGNVRKKYITHQFFNVFNIKGLNGEDPALLSTSFAEMNASGSFADAHLFQNFEFARDYKDQDISKHVGEEYILNDDSLNYKKLNLFINPFRFTEYSKNWSDALFMPFVKDSTPVYLPSLDLSIRISSNASKVFFDDFNKNVIGIYREGNVLVNALEPYDQIRDRTTLLVQRKIQESFVGLSFLMLNTLLGLLGIFWFRGQQRRSEIALQMALGASKRQIFMNQLVEGLILLSIATIPAIIIDYFLSQYELTEYFDGGYFTLGRFASTVGITYLLMLVMIVVGIGIPAWRAMQIEPAEALHEE
ncbi:MAG: ABC transporter permease [Tannerellaceae bacterium]